jgi:surface antigen
MRRLRAMLWMLGYAALSACGTSGSGQIGRYAPVDCAPFARALTGVQLSGAAEDWWYEAAGRYQRTGDPQVGAILVLSRSTRLPDGHVAVVSRLVSAREMLVTQANWVHHRVTEDQPVIDVSPRNDWSLVQVWWPPADQMGLTRYTALGFILPDQPTSHDALIAATPGAIRLAENE